MALCLPALAGGIELDDLFHAQHAARADFTRSAFTFFGQGPRAPHVPASDLPWWTEPGLRLDLFRPVAALTHRLDYALWPEQPWLMHLHSVLWYGVLVGLLLRLYRALSDDPARAALAALIFGLSQAHAMNVGWLSARNATIAATFVVATLLLHHRWRSRGWTPGAVLAPVALGLALLANEGAIAAGGYLLAYALVRDRGRVHLRVATLLPYLGVAIAWRVAYAAWEHGASGGGIYLDPMSDPLRYVGRTLVQAVPMLASRLGLGVLDPFGSIPGAAIPLLFIALPFVLGVAWVVRERLREDPCSRMWAVGLLLCLGTAGTSVPTDRGAMLLSLGGCALLADFILWLRREDAPALHRRLAALFIGLHLVLSPLLLPVRVLTTAWVHGMAESITEALPDEPGVEDETVVLVNAPSDLVMLYSRAIRAEQQQAFPRRLQWLYAGPGTLTLTRVGPRSIELRSDQPWLAAPLDRMFRDAVQFRPGQRIERECIVAQVLEVDAGSLATAVRFQIADDGDCRPRFMQWDGATKKHVPLTLPAEGETITLDAARIP